ncbi:histone-lysine N-methyltransferase SETMAR [Trichonephila clavipes]|nr:histone-lysine N-methyltransferase SETMAR [Trichonephila clavipes]
MSVRFSYPESLSTPAEIEPVTLGLQGGHATTQPQQCTDPPVDSVSYGSLHTKRIESQSIAISTNHSESDWFGLVTTLSNNPRTTVPAFTSVETGSMRHQSRFRVIQQDIFLKGQCVMGNEIPNSPTPALLNESPFERVFDNACNTADLIPDRQIGKVCRRRFDAPRTGRPGVENVDKITEIIEVDRHVSHRSIIQELKIDHKTVFSYLSKVGFKKKLDVWVPNQLTPTNVMDRISIGEAMAKRNEIDHFLKRMVTGDKKWVTYDNIVSKRSWLKCGEVAKTGQTLNSDLYCQQQDSFKLATDQKRRELANRRGVVFHQDNAPPHTSVGTCQKLWEWPRLLSGHNHELVVCAVQLGVRILVSMETRPVEEWAPL